MEKFTDIAIVIPSLNPTELLLDLLHGLRARTDASVLIVNDGSREECLPIFERAAQVPGVTVLRHFKNMGKGRALKNAFNHFLVHTPDAIGLVTADADGQHCPEDIVRCMEALRKSPGSLILGCRDFDDKTVPWKSKFGNKITCFSFLFFGGIRVSDTQTGLRGIPAAYMKHLLDAPGERFEYETVMLLDSRKAHCHTKIEEISIRTIYEGIERETHFRPLVDSIKIYKVILKESYLSFTAFLCSGLLAALIDQGLFSLFYYKLLPALKIGGTLLISMITARMISLLFNYFVNKYLVFRDKEKLLDGRSIFLFSLLCIWTICLSYFLVKGIIWLFPGANVLLVKIIVDSTIFFQNYLVQKHLCFRRS